MLFLYDKYWTPTNTHPGWQEQLPMLFYHKWPQVIQHPGCHWVKEWQALWLVYSEHELRKFIDVTFLPVSCCSSCCEQMSHALPYLYHKWSTECVSRNVATGSFQIGCTKGWEGGGGRGNRGYDSLKQTTKRMAQKRLDRIINST